MPDAERSDAGFVVQHTSARVGALASEITDDAAPSIEARAASEFAFMWTSEKLRPSRGICLRDGVSVEVKLRLGPRDVTVARELVSGRVTA